MFNFGNSLWLLEVMMMFLNANAAGAVRLLDEKMRLN